VAELWIAFSRGLDGSSWSVANLLALVLLTLGTWEIRGRHGA
jgi:hypothetical protein